MKAKNWFQIFIACLIALLSIIAGFNYKYNSMWLFNNNDDNLKYSILDERQQKTNFISNDNIQYSNVVLGSSRASYIDVNKLGSNWMNYAASGMYIDEFISYAKYSEKQSENNKIDTFLIALDFWGISKNAIVTYSSISEIVNKSNSLSYRFGHLITWDALSLTLKNIQLNKYPEPNTAFYTLPRFYKNRTKTSSLQKEQIIKDQLWYYQKDVFNTDFKLRTDYFELLDSFKRIFPNSTIIYFDTPVSNGLKKIINNTCDDDFKKWKYQLEKYDYQYFNSDTIQFEDSNFYDSHHLKSEYITLLAQKALSN